ncbi:hypothetical protein PHJA_001801700 [Phtheirospermum japonicum]|uniref:Uncharacterized protein n=1 Tax=Phtheirospermum japonicum TaxID=374723 RepID=A0A830CBL1_9LAMI|nr:hypothetical protein PHJA_001801700 [Phtheirospermum japonicum]
MLLQRNNFTGRVPQSPPWPCSTVDLSHNSLAGELPAALAGAETLFLNNNRLNGVVPDAYVESVGKRYDENVVPAAQLLDGIPDGRGVHLAGHGGSLRFVQLYGGAAAGVGGVPCQRRGTALPAGLSVLGVPLTAAAQILWID